MPEDEKVSIANNVLSASQEGYGEKYADHLLQQYVLYVQMADKVSDRRSIANTFFLTANTIILSLLGLIMSVAPFRLASGGWLALMAAISPILLCYAWLRIVVSYQQLNTGKFAVIHEVEKKLPLALYKAEWQALGEGRDSRLYRPLTDVEKWVPIIFMALYVLLGVGAFFRGI